MGPAKFGMFLMENAYKLCREFCKTIAGEGLITVSIGVTAVNLSDTIKRLS